MKLTVGMAVYDDFAACAMTVQSLRLHQGLSAEDLEIVVIDNHPAGADAGRLKGFCGQAGARYVPFPEPVGTSAPRGEILNQATSDVVVVLDAHVLLAPQSLSRLAEHALNNPDSLDLWQGPMLHDTLSGGDQLATHMRPEWGDDLMFGRWGYDPRGADLDAPPFEIPMQGLGLFACRRAAWLGFPEGLAGFGGEEGMLHEQFRQAGRRALCLPFLRWWHLFRDATSRAPVCLVDRFRNYLVWYRALGKSEAELAELMELFRPRLRAPEFAAALEATGNAAALEMPSWGKRGWNFAKAMARHVASGAALADEPTHKGRLEVCAACPFLEGEVWCRLCGCKVEDKAMIATQSCPAGKWPGDAPQPAPAVPVPRFDDGCPHQAYHADCQVQNLTVGESPEIRRLATLTITCGQCKRPMLFPAAGGRSSLTLEVVPTPASAK